MSTETPDDAIAERLRRTTMHLYQRMRQESGNETAITPSRYSALSTIEANSPLRMSDLARAERVSKSSITRIVATLTELGLVELIADPTDGRSTLVGVTTQGKQVLASTSDHTDAFLAQQLTAFSDAELAMLDAAILLLERLASGKSR